MNIIFDMDGTLVDSAILSIVAFEKLCPKHEIELPTLDAVKSAMGYANPEYYYKIFPNVCEERVYALGLEVEKYELSYAPLVKDKLLFCGVKEMLAEFSKMNITMYIASTGSKEHVHSCLTHSGVIHHFSEFGADEENKEHMVQRLISGRNPNDFVMIGDRDKDSNAARFNNIMCIGAAFGYCTPNFYPLFDKIAYSTQELTELIKGMV